jgi:hypothetical protein
MLVLAALLVSMSATSAFAAEGSAVQFTESMTGDKHFNALGSFDNAPLGSTTGASVWLTLHCTTGLFPAAFVAGPIVSPAPGLPE